MHITIKTYYRILFFLVCFIIAPSSFAGERFQSSYHCLESQRNCSDVKGRWVEGVYVEPKCWKFQYIKTCAYPSLDDCARLSHCYFVQLVDCLLKDHYGNCVNQKKEFSCKRWVPHTIEEQRVRTDLIEKEGQEGLICKGLPCIDGNCVNKAYDTNGEMMDSISKLYATSQMKGGKDLNFKLFEGTNQQCSKKATSYSNCCSENLPGWGRNIGAGCTQDEMTLIQNRKKNLCVYVGKQNKQTMGVTTVVKHQFCCFGNMLDKVIQVEGRKQLNGRVTNNFGSGGSPDCRGLTLEEIQRIDFSRLDFSEFIEDFKVKFFGKYKQPNSADITARVNGSQNNIRRYDGKPHNPKNNLTGWNLGLKDDSFEAEEERRLENERRRQLDASVAHKRPVAEEWDGKRKRPLFSWIHEATREEEEAEARKLIAIEEEKRAARRKVVEDKLNLVKAELEYMEQRYISSWGGLQNSYKTHLEYVRGRYFPRTDANDIVYNRGPLKGEVEQFIKNVWDKYKYHPEYCEEGSHLRPNTIWHNPDFTIAHNGGPVLCRHDWCRHVRELQKLENDLRNGNY